MNALQEVIHSARELVNEHRHAYPPVWAKDANEIIDAAAAELAALRARVGELGRGLGECVNVLEYIGHGVSAHSMAEQYAKLYKPLLTEEQIQESHERVKARYDEELAVLLAEHAALAKGAK